MGLVALVGNMNTMKEIFNKRKELDLNDEIPNLFKRQDLIPKLRY